jgi:transcriptional regulator with PAS, ATPase and Fis domain
LSAELLASELFGHERGAFTGANTLKRGLAESADGGTLFLDEIGDMPLSMQTRLLRVLQERQVTPLGGGKPVDVDFTLICASHRKLREDADRGVFRSDLYYRINGLTVNLPALRERNDFQALTERILSDLNPGRHVYLSPDLLAQVSLHPWPGNIRQYSSMLRTASAMLNPNENCIDWEHLSDDLVEELTALQQPALQEIAVVIPQNLKELSRTAIQQALESSHGNISAAARRLGISRQTLYRKLEH